MANNNTSTAPSNITTTTNRTTTTPSSTTTINNTTTTPSSTTTSNSTTTTTSYDTTTDLSYNATIEAPKANRTGCNIYRDYVRRSDTFFGLEEVEGYAGVPQNFVINIVGFVLMIILFSWLRKKAWNYGRIAVVQRIEDSARKRQELDHVQWKPVQDRDSKRVYKYPTDGQHAIPITYGDVKNKRSHNILPSGAPPPTAQTSKTSGKSENSTGSGLGRTFAEVDEAPRPSEIANPGELLLVPVDVVFKKSTNTTEPGETTRPTIDTESILPSIIPSVNETHSKINRMSLKRENSHRYSKITMGNESVIMDSGLFSWIKILFTLTDHQIEAKSGTDCVIYLSFQRHLIALALIMTVSCLLIVLPINIYNGDLAVNTHKIPFHQATMINISKKRWVYLYTHQALTLFYFGMSLWIMTKFSKVVKFTKKEKTKKSIMITGIAKKYCNETNLRNHFREIFPEGGIREITLAFDIRHLQILEIQRQRAELAKTHYENVFKENGLSIRPTVKPYVLGAICPRACCCCCKSVDAIKFYTEMEARMGKEVETEKEIALTKSLGIAFITFKSPAIAKSAVDLYSFWSRIRRVRPHSKVGKQLNSSTWNVEYAPPPNDLYWENLTSHERLWYAKALLVNVVLLIVVIFVTTPVFLIEFLVRGTFCANSSSSIQYCFKPGNAQSASSITGLLLDTLPTFLLWITAAILPSLVAVSDEIVRFWTKSADNRSRMIKTFLFLIFMIIIMPSLGITSLKTAIPAEGIKNNQGPRWTCIFSDENGSLFANYLITSTFLGTASELLRIPELLLYFCKILFAKSTAEIESVRGSVVYDFPIGSQYAWFMLNFAIFSIFCVIIPVITPFGLLYLVFRYLVDRYNIYFAYGPTKVKQEVHGTAINFVLACLFILQMNMFVYILEWDVTWGGAAVEPSYPAATPEIYALRSFSILVFALTLTLFIFQVMFNVCTSFGPNAKLPFAAPRDEDNYDHDASRLSEVSVGASYSEKDDRSSAIQAHHSQETGYQASLGTMLPGGSGSNTPARVSAASYL